MFEKYLTKLKSADSWVLEETIDEISTIYEDAPVGEVRELLLKHCDHEDPGVRRVALRTVAMHWAFPEAFHFLKKILLSKDQEDDEVLDVVSCSVGRYKDNNVITDKEINDLYVSSLESIFLSDEHKKNLYISFLRYHGVLDIKEYASLILSLNIEINMNLVYEIISEIGKN